MHSSAPQTSVSLELAKISDFVYERAGIQLNMAANLKKIIRTWKLYLHLSVYEADALANTPRSDITVIKLKVSKYIKIRKQ